MFRIWKTNLKTKGVRINVSKIKIMLSARNTPKPVETSKYPCGVCSKGVKANSIKCHVYGIWVYKRYKRCSNVEDPTIPDIKTLLISMVKKPEKSDFFVTLVTSLDNFLSSGFFDATTARIRYIWKKFREVLPIFACHGLSLKRLGFFEKTQSQRYNDDRMDLLHKPYSPDTIELRSRLDLCNIENVLRRECLR